jgi:archaemetzincin
MDIQIFWDRGSPKGLEIPVARMISQILDIPVQIYDSPLLYNGYTVSRQQFDASVILSCIDTYKRRNAIESPVLLVICEDIFHAASRYVFGLARPRTGSSVVSTTRLRNEYWDLPADETLLCDRIITEGAHELGHILGLHHCLDQRCIMYNPRCLDDLNNKNLFLCDPCRNNLQVSNERLIKRV